MKKQKRKIITMLLLAGILITGTSTQAAVQNLKRFGEDKLKNVTTKEDALCSGIVGSGAHNATEEITERIYQFPESYKYCDVYFTHKNLKTNKYATIGIWIRNAFGKANSVYLSNSKVIKNKTKMQTRVKTKKNAWTDKTAIAGTVKY